MEFQTGKRMPFRFHPALSYPLSPGGITQDDLEEKGTDSWPQEGPWEHESGAIGSGEGE